MLRRLVYGCCQVAAYLMSRVLWGARAEGQGHVPRSGPVLLAVSHESVLDPVIVGGLVRRPIRYLARDTLFGKGGKVALHGRVLKYVGAVPIRRDGGGARGAVRAAEEQLADAQVVLIFPEGTRSPDGVVREFRRGVGLIAAASGCPVVPVSLDGSHRLWRKGARLPKLFGGPVHVRFGAPVTYSKTTTPKDVAADLRDRVLALRQRSAGNGAEIVEAAGGSLSQGEAAGDQEPNLRSDGA